MSSQCVWVMAPLFHMGIWRHLQATVFSADKHSVPYWLTNTADVELTFMYSYKSASVYIIFSSIWLMILAGGGGGVTVGAGGVNLLSIDFVSITWYVFAIGCLSETSSNGPGLNNTLIQSSQLWPTSSRQKLISYFWNATSSQSTQNYSRQQSDQNFVFEKMPKFCVVFFFFTPDHRENLKIASCHAQRACSNISWLICLLLSSKVPKVEATLRSLSCPSDTISRDPSYL